YLHKSNAALVAGGREAGDIAGDAAAEGDDGGVAAITVLQQVGVNLLGRGQCFAGFAVVKHQGVGIPVVQCRQQWRQMPLLDDVVGDHQHARATDGIRVDGGVGKQA